MAREIICSCGRKYLYEKGKGHTLTNCNSCRSNKARLKNKLKYIEYKGGKCEICGYSKLIQALEFHHLIKKDKLFVISGNHTRKWDSVKKELDKCILVCANCHREIEYGLINLSAPSSSPV